MRTIQDVKDEITHRYGEFSQKEHLGHLLLTGIEQNLSQLSGIGIPLYLTDEGPPVVPGDRFPMVLHDGNGGNLLVKNESQYEDGLAKGWKDLTLPPATSPAESGDIIPHHDGDGTDGAKDEE